MILVCFLFHFLDFLGGVFCVVLCYIVFAVSPHNFTGYEIDRGKIQEPASQEQDFRDIVCRSPVKKSPSVHLIENWDEREFSEQPDFVLQLQVFHQDFFHICLRGRAVARLRNCVISVIQKRKKLIHPLRRHARSHASTNKLFGLAFCLSFLTQFLLVR